MVIGLGTCMPQGEGHPSPLISLLLLLEELSLPLYDIAAAAWGGAPLPLDKLAAAAVGGGPFLPLYKAVAAAGGVAFSPPHLNFAAA